MKSQCAGWRRGSLPHRGDSAICLFEGHHVTKERGRQPSRLRRLPATQSAPLTGELPAECLLVDLELVYCPVQLPWIGTFYNNSIPKGREINGEDGGGLVRLRGEEFEGPVGQIFSSITTLGVLVSLFCCVTKIRVFRQHKNSYLMI